MRHYAANYIFTGEELIKNSYISVDKSGTISYIGKENEGQIERPFMIFYNGIICPGFVNAHCHLELSDFVKSDEEGKGLTYFIRSIIAKRNHQNDENKLKTADILMFERGVNLVGDIVNTDKTVKIKTNSKICYHSFIELSGIKNIDSKKKISFAEELSAEFSKNRLANSIVPHALYSISPDLFKYTAQSCESKLTSLHFLESDEEADFFSGVKNPIYSFMQGINSDYKPLATDLVELYSLLLEFKNSTSTILVHNTLADSERIPSRSNFYLCLCPSSNLYLHKKLPSEKLVYANKDRLVVGTDSLASTNRLDIIQELKLLDSNYQQLSMLELLKIATSNGADALKNNNYGRFLIGNTPGVVLIENLDLINLKFRDNSFAKRII
jgi:cytosine/adenosine deaminase-related metal-dependent hydrolase